MHWFAQVHCINIRIEKENKNMSKENEENISTYA
jgi:hypothetical protein